MFSAPKGAPPLPWIDRRWRSKVARLSAETAVPVREATSKLRTPSLKAISKDILTNLFVYMRDADVPPPDCGGRPHGRRGQIVQVQTTLSELQSLAEDENVAYFGDRRGAEGACADAVRPAPRSSITSVRRFGDAAQHRYGEDVLIGIIDVQGFDFAHPDFLDRDGQDALRPHLGPGRRRTAITARRDRVRRQFELRRGVPGTRSQRGA